MAGKPYAPIYRCALETLDKAAGRTVDRARVLAIGDALATDVRGANGQDIDCLFVAAGIDAAATLNAEGGLDPVKLEAMLLRGDARAAYALTDLVW
jgi:ribonucleotide monophosphatase NagD (HAD superfamily)